MLQRIIKYFSFWDLAVLLICIAFVVVKIPYLNLPYLWDEAWVYAPAVFEMYENGPSLSPNSIDPQLSRGHPILFHFLAVCWMTIFGSDFIAIHSFSLFLSLCLLIAVYSLGKQLLNSSTGFWAAALLAIQPIFLMHSGFLLPEIQVALFTILTIKFYLRKSTLLFILSGACLLLTKETGILTIGIIGLVELFQFASERDFSKKRVVRLLSVGAPVLLAFLFFFVQYLQFGWFMFPEHMDMFNTDSPKWQKKIGLAIDLLFFQQKRYLLIAAGLATLGLGWVRGPKLARLIAVILALSFITIKGLDSWLPQWYFFYGLPIMIVLFMFTMMSPLRKDRTLNHLFFPITMLLVLTMIVFTCSHVLINRYFLFLFPLLTILVSTSIHLSLRHAVWLRNTVLICIGFMVYHNMNRIDTKKRRDNLRYIECINVCQRTVDYLLENVENKKTCISGPYAFRDALHIPAAGYVTSEEIFRCLPTRISPNTVYIVDISYEPSSLRKTLKQTNDFKEVWRTEDRDEWAVVYKRIKR